MSQNSAIFAALFIGWIIFATNRGDMIKIIALLRGAGKVDATKGNPSEPASKQQGIAAPDLGKLSQGSNYSGQSTMGYNSQSPINGGDIYSNTGDVTNSGAGSTANDTAALTYSDTAAL